MRNTVTRPALAALVWAVTMGGAMAESATVSGTAGYRERIALPPGAQLEVRLMDVSRMDVAATMLSARRFAMTGVPQAFSLVYDPALIDDRKSYVLQAEIHHDGKVRFRTTQAYPVLTRGGGDSADLILTRAPEPGAMHATRLTGAWEVVELMGRGIDADDPPLVDFSEPGRIGVRGACNSFSGAADPNGSNLSFAGPIAGTMKACPPEQERIDRDLIAALEATDRLDRDGDALRLLDTDGRTLAELRRAE